MIWCWQQDPEVRPTATDVVEVAKNEQFCRLIDGIHIDDNARVLCACKREIVVTLQQRCRSSYKFKRTNSFHLDISSSYQDFKESVSSLETSEILPSSARSISEGQFLVSNDENDNDRPLSPADKNDGTLNRKLNAVHKYELWISSSDIHSSRVTIIDYCGKFTGIKVTTQLNGKHIHTHKITCC